MTALSCCGRVATFLMTKVGRLPAVALSVFARTEDRTRALRAGFNMHLSNPLDPYELIAATASFTGRIGGRGVLSQS